MKASLPQLSFIMTQPQAEIFTDPARFRVVVAGRRFGKTFLSKYELVNAALAKPNSQVAYIAPTRSQAKQLMWLPLKDFVPPRYVRKKEEVDLTMTLINGSQIFLRGAENETGLLGLGLNLVVLDEFARMQETIWSMIVRPTLSDKLGRALFISTPVGMASWVYKLWEDAEHKPNWSRHHYTTIDGGNVPPEEVETARNEMDPRIFKQEYLASFESLAGRVYYAYDPEKNDEPEVSDDGVSPLVVGIDFNVSPMTAVIGQMNGGRLYIFDELYLLNANTDLLCQEIKRRYPNRQVITYPDPSGASRKTSAVGGVTDHTIIRSHGFQLYTPGSAYPVSTKINTLNRALKDANDQVRLFIKKAPSTKHIRQSLLGLTFVEGTSIPDPKSDYMHITDALGYLCAGTLPISDPVRILQVLG